MIKTNWTLNKIGYGGTVAAHPLVRHYLAPALSGAHHNNDVGVFVYLRCFRDLAGAAKHQVVTSTFDTCDVSMRKRSSMAPCGVEWNSTMCEKVAAVCTDMYNSVTDWRNVAIGRRSENLGCIFPERKFVIVISHPDHRDASVDRIDTFATSTAKVYRASDVMQAKSWLDW